MIKLNNLRKFLVKTNIHFNGGACIRRYVKHSPQIIPPSTNGTTNENGSSCHVQNNKFHDNNELRDFKKQNVIASRTELPHALGNTDSTSECKTSDCAERGDLKSEALRREKFTESVNILENYLKEKVDELVKLMEHTARLDAGYNKDDQENTYNKNSRRPNDERTITLKDDLNFPAFPHQQDNLSSLNDLASAEIAGSSSSSKDLQALKRALKLDKVQFKMMREMEQKSLDEKFKKEATTHLRLCVHIDMVPKGHTYLTNCYRTRNNKHTSDRRRVTVLRPIKDINVYAELVDAWAKKGNYEGVWKSYNQIQDLNMKPTLEVFASIFECLGAEKELNAEAVKRYLFEVHKNGLNLEEIFQGKIYTPKEKELVMKAISPFVPNLIPKQYVPVKNYDCDLLNHLNKDKPIPNPFAGILNSESLLLKMKQQFKLERSERVWMKSIARESSSSTALAARENLEKHKVQWRKELKKKFLENVRSTSGYNTQSPTGILLFPSLKLWEEKEYVKIMMQELDSLGRDYFQFMATRQELHVSLGSKVENKHRKELKVKRMDEFLKVHHEYYEKSNKEHLPANHRNILNDIYIANAYREVVSEDWSYERKKEIGKFLYDIMLGSVHMYEFPTPDELIQNPNAEPRRLHLALNSHPFMNDNKRDEEIKMSDDFEKLFKQARLSKISFAPQDLPSLVPPIPRTSPNQGGFLIAPVELIKTPWLHREQSNWIRSISNQKHFPTYDGLNVLSNCPWKVNKSILDLVTKIFRNGGNDALTIPTLFDSEPEKIKITEDMSNEEESAAMKHNEKMKRKEDNQYSLWCSMLYKLSIASNYRDDVFWFPHNIDFRGRAYPIPPHLNHNGDDLTRSLLMFGTGKKLGPKGLEWLKLHLINLTGFKKRHPYEDRLVYANEMMDVILDSADKPLDGQLWWQTCDKPWQTLACCMELAQAVRSENPEEYISHLPIHQDGSCNGLQHYAALGRDTKGAKSVCLYPLSRPQDIYSEVAAKTEEDRKNDAAKGNEIAKYLEGHVQRKVIKQSVMTTVYGVTLYGAMKQIQGQLKDMPGFNPEMVGPAKGYLAKKVFENIGKLFHSAEQIQAWFDDCCALISDFKKSKMSWTTPIGWPVVQHYVKMAVDEKTRASYEKPNARKQKNAFAPNFIHSLDSTHMFLTAIHCLDSGIPFASVHDCFWTHACHVDEMNKICRDQFVALHKQPILNNLSQHFIEEFGYPEIPADGDASKTTAAHENFNNILTAIPKQGDFDIELVKQSKYFFS